MCHLAAGLKPSTHLCLTHHVKSFCMRLFLNQDTATIRQSGRWHLASPTVLSWSACLTHRLLLMAILVVWQVSTGVLVNLHYAKHSTGTPRGGWPVHPLAHDLVPLVLHEVRTGLPRCGLLREQLVPACAHVLSGHLAHGLQQNDGIYYTVWYYGPIQFTGELDGPEVPYSICHP